MEAKKRGRGRPKKALGATIPPPPKGKRGRPKKVNKIEAYTVKPKYNSIWHYKELKTSD